MNLIVVPIPGRISKLWCRDWEFALMARFLAFLPLAGAGSPLLEPERWISGDLGALPMKSFGSFNRLFCTP